MRRIWLPAILVLAMGMVGCRYSATVEAYNWTDSPPRDVECEVDGVAKVVPGDIWDYPWKETWKVSWPNSSDSYSFGIRVRELWGSWSSTLWGSVVRGEVVYVDIEEGTFYVYKGMGPQLRARFATDPPDLEELRSLKEGAGE